MPSCEKIETICCFDPVKELKKELKDELNIFLQDVERKLDELGNSVIKLKHESSQFNDRLQNIIDSLENDLSLRLKEIERFIKITHLQYKKNIGHCAKSSYKCPLCDRSGYLHLQKENMAGGSRCHLCEGKGIVWG